MIGATHIALTRAVMLDLLPPMLHAYGCECAESSALPDDMEDIKFGAFGTKVAGHRTGALDHFVVRTTGELFRGYNWHLDGSLWHCIRDFDPRLGECRCLTGQWDQVMDDDDAKRHPLILLLDALHGHASTDADDVTFPTAAIMAEWIWGSVLARDGVAGLPPSLPNPRAVGCVCHMIQDACVPHHARGWLAKGHASFEDRVDAVLNTSDPVVLSAEADCLLGTPPHMPRSIVEDAALMSRGLLDRPDAERACLVLGFAWTRAFVRWTPMAEL